MNPEKFKVCYNRLQYLKDCHFEASSKCHFWHLLTAFPLVGFAALANAGIWATIIQINEAYKNTVNIVVAILGAIVMVYSAIQAFLGLDKKSEEHKNAATRYSRLSGDVDRMLEQPENLRIEDLEIIFEKWSLITESAPLLPKKMAKRNPQKDIKDQCKKIEKPDTINEG